MGGGGDEMGTERLGRWRAVSEEEGREGEILGAGERENLSLANVLV